MLVMKSGRRIASLRLPLWKTALVLLLVTSAGVSAPQRKEDTAKTLIWDTLSPFVNTVDFRDRNSWKPVPTDLLRLELDPLAAFSDPGYYGREYSFKGDVVVENEHLTTVFSSKKGCVVIYSRDDSSQKKVELIPLQLKESRRAPPLVHPDPCRRGGVHLFFERDQPLRGAGRALLPAGYYKIRVTRQPWKLLFLLRKQKIITLPFSRSTRSRLSRLNLPRI